MIAIEQNKFWEKNMLLDKNQCSSDYDIEFLLERPVGWSSACFDSTINYYLNCNETSREVLNEESGAKPEEVD